MKIKEKWDDAAHESAKLLARAMQCVPVKAALEKFDSDLADEVLDAISAHQRAERGWIDEVRKAARQ